MVKFKEDKIWDFYLKANALEFTRADFSNRELFYSRGGFEVSKSELKAGIGYAGFVDGCCKNANKLEGPKGALKSNTTRPYNNSKSFEQLVNDIVYSSKTKLSLISPKPTSLDDLFDYSIQYGLGLIMHPLLILGETDSF